MRLSIHYKITLVFGTILAVILLGIYIYLDNNLREFTYQRIRTSLHKETLLAKSLLEHSTTDGLQSEDMDDIADEIGRSLQLRVTIIAPDGTVLGDSELDRQQLDRVENHLYRVEVQQAVRSGFGESRRSSTTLKKSMLYSASVFGRDSVEGIVRLSVSLSEIAVVSGHVKRLLIFSLLFAFLLVVTSGFLASLLISRPIKEMSLAARSIADGDFSRGISISSRDEIGDMARALNHMVEQIRFKIEEVTSSKSRLEAVLLSMCEGVMVVDAEGTILLMNKALKDFLLVKEEPSSRKPLEVIRNIEIQETVDSALELRCGVESREITLLLPVERVLLVHATPILRENKTEGAVLVFHDISELRRLEKIRQDFIANVSHELRTPVSTIKGYAETLLEGALEDKENAHDFLNIIHSDADRLARLIGDLLDLSKIESGKLALTLKPCSVESIVGRVLPELNRQAQDKAIAIETHFPEAISNILADEKMLAQVVLNLVDNAVKYTERGGRVKVSAREKADFVQVDVSDTGIGIAQKDLPRVFERFYRVDRVRSDELGGTGLGLSISKHIVQAHGGEVSAQSVLGQGSTFSFTIPKAV